MIRNPRLERPEREILAEILARLGRRPDMRVWRNNTGVGLTADGVRTVSYGLPGSSDILGILGACWCGNGHHARSRGRMLAIEAKRAGRRASEGQRAFLAMINKLGGVAFVARSADEAEDELHKRGFCPWGYG